MLSDEPRNDFYYNSFHFNKD
jgi:predicted RNA methylase